MNELIIKSFLINTYSLICLLPKEIENISISVKKITHDDLFNKTLVDIKNFSPLFTKEAIQESLNNAKYFRIIITSRRQRVDLIF